MAKNNQFMKLEMSAEDLKMKKFLEMDLDKDSEEENDEKDDLEEENESDDDAGFDDEVFGNLTAQIQGHNLKLAIVNSITVPLKWCHPERVP